MVGVNVQALLSEIKHYLAKYLLINVNSLKISLWGDLRIFWGYFPNCCQILYTTGRLINLTYLTTLNFPILLNIKV